MLIWSPSVFCDFIGFLALVSVCMLVIIAKQYQQDDGDSYADNNYYY